MTSRSRYPGTQPFGDSADDYARFFGRAEESEQLYLRVLSVPLLVQFGKSGLGKTSLLQAGLFPRLRSRPFLPVMIRLNDTADSLTAAVARSLKQSCEAEGIEYTERPAAGLWELLSTTLWRDDLLLTPVLVFDQFEEVFTLRDAAFRAEIATELGALASGIAPARLASPGSRPAVKIVISLREDYLGALEEFSTSIPGLFHERLRLEAFTEKEAREAIVGPAQLEPAEGEEPYGSPKFTFDAPALAAMIDYLKGTSGVIEPFQLQLLCRNAETIAQEKSASTQDPVELTLADFKGSRDFASVLQNFYRDTLQKIATPSQRKRAQILAEEGLLGAAGHRLMLEEGQILGDYGLTNETLATLARERLVRRERRLDSVFYEISHDRLSESIYRSRRNKLPRKWRRALWAGALIALVVVATLSFFSYRVQTARNRAEGLLGFLLGEQFLGDVRDVGRSSLLELVQKKVEDPRAQRHRADFNRGLALRNRGDVHRSRGDLKRSIESFREALEVFEQDSGEIDGQREAARTHDRLGWAYYDEGDVAKSLWHYDAAVRTWKEVVDHPTQEQPELLRDDCTSLADSLVAAGDVNGRMGRATDALTHVQEAISVASNILFGAHGSHQRCGVLPTKAEPYPDGKVLEVLSRAALSRASILYFHQDYEGAAILATQARWLRPMSVAARQNERLALLYRATDIGNEQRSLDDCRAARADFEELIRWDPANPQWLYERAVARLLVAQSILACRAQAGSCTPMPSLQEAEATVLDGLATLRSIGAIDPDNRTWAGGRAWALQTHAAVLKALGRNAERLPKLEEAERIYSARDRADVEGVLQLGRVFGDKADALMALGRTSEAKAALQHAIDLMTTLVTAHPDNPTYVFSLLTARKGEASVLHAEGANAQSVDEQVARLTAKYAELTAAVAKQAETLAGTGTQRLEAGEALSKKGDTNGAVREFREAEKASFQSIELQPAEFQAYANLQAAHTGLARAQRQLGHTAEEGAARTSAMHAAQLAAWLAQTEDDQKTSNVGLFRARAEMGDFLYRTQRLEESLQMVHELVTFAERIAEQPNPDANDIAILGLAKWSLGELRRKQKNAGWEETMRSALVHLQTAVTMPNGERHWKWVGMARKTLAKALAEDGRTADAALERDLAVKAYRQAAPFNPGDSEVDNAIRDLTGGG